MMCDKCCSKHPMHKMTVVGKNWDEKWLCPKCIKIHEEKMNKNRPTNKPTQNKEKCTTEPNLDNTAICNVEMDLEVNRVK